MKITTKVTVFCVVVAAIGWFFADQNNYLAVQHWATQEQPSIAEKFRDCFHNIFEVFNTAVRRCYIDWLQSDLINKKNCLKKQFAWRRTIWLHKGYQKLLRGFISTIASTWTESCMICSPGGFEALAWFYFVQSFPFQQSDSWISAPLTRSSQMVITSFCCTHHCYDDHCKDVWELTTRFPRFCLVVTSRRHATGLNLPKFELRNMMVTLRAETSILLPRANEKWNPAPAWSVVNLRLD